MLFDLSPLLVAGVEPDYIFAAMLNAIAMEGNNARMALTLDVLRSMSGDVTIDREPEA